MRWRDRNAASASDNEASSRFELGKAGAPDFRRERETLSRRRPGGFAGNEFTLRFRPGEASHFSYLFDLLNSGAFGIRPAPQRKWSGRTRSRSAIFLYCSAFLTFFLRVDLSTARLAINSLSAALCSSFSMSFRSLVTASSTASNLLEWCVSYWGASVRCQT